MKHLQKLLFSLQILMTVHQIPVIMVVHVQINSTTSHVRALRDTPEKIAKLASALILYM